MKVISRVVGILLLLASTAVFESEAASDTREARPVVWVGIDYSMTRFIGPNDFRDPVAIFPGMLEAWNALFVQERVEKLSERLRHPVIMDLQGLPEVNAKANSKQVIPFGGVDDVIDKSHITTADLAAAVRDYRLTAKEGVGLVFVVDRLIKPTVNGAVYVVYFDLGSREILSSERRVGKAGGFGFRNYWFGVIKKVADEIRWPAVLATPSKKGSR
ncbi:MAG: hypothetical protein JNK85_15750 [Verrucomicrobiales bacterium]|nr:hypothetical protein [Verrucomicrobiales bacterium]